MDTKMDLEQQFERNEYIMCRPRAPPTNAAVFAEMDDRMRGALGDPSSVYIGSVDRFGSVTESRRQDQISVEMWKEADEEITKLFALMAEVRAKMDKKSPSDQLQRANVNLRQCTWEQVLGEVQSLSTRWSTSPKKASKSMVYLENIGKNSDALKCWLELLPEGDYGSRYADNLCAIGPGRNKADSPPSICGVFSLAIGAVGAFTKVEAIILETMAEIPEVMDDAKRYIEIYGVHRDQRLERKTFELYLSILTALKHIMQFFADSSWSKPQNALLTRFKLRLDTEEHHRQARLKAKRVKNEAQICMQKRNVDLNEAIRLQQAVLGDLNEKTDRMLAASNVYYQLLRDLEAQFRRNCEQPGYTAQPLQAPTDKRLLEYEQKRDLERAKDLLEVLRYDPDVVLRDTMTCLRLGAALEEVGKARAAALIRNPTFKTFVTETTTSSALLVNGNEDISNAEGVSPLSLVAARLAQISEHNETTQGLTLRYFCVEHGSYGRENPDSSPTEVMMASLTGQLVSHMVSRSVAIDLSFLGQEDWDLLGRPNLKVMCTAFFKLVKQLLPGTVVLCILDEVSFYETNALNRDADTAVRRLVRLVEACDEIVFKLLVTCRGRALGIGQYFHKNTLDLDEEVEADDSSTWQIANIGSKP